MYVNNCEQHIEQDDQVQNSSDVSNNDVLDNRMTNK